MKYATRREALGKSLQLGAAVALPLVESGVKAESLAADRGLKIIVAGAHPNDPETGCGGTIARFSDLGHEVVVLYLTRGERGIKGKSYDEAGTIRTAEAQKACEILKARPLFAGQVNGRVEVLRPTFDGGEPSAASRVFDERLRCP